MFLQEYSSSGRHVLACVSIIHKYSVLSAVRRTCRVIHVTGVAERWVGQWVGLRCPAMIHIRRGAARSPRGQPFVMALIYEAWPGRTAEFGSAYNEKSLSVCLWRKCNAWSIACRLYGDYPAHLCWFHTFFRAGNDIAQMIYSFRAISNSRPIWCAFYIYTWTKVACTDLKLYALWCCC